MKTMFQIILYTHIISGVLLLSCCSDGENYNSSKIGTQQWMVKNLDAFYFRNGDPIPLAKSDEDWNKAGQEGKPACCYYNNYNINGDKFGVLYNWFAVIDKRGLAPKGWHIPNPEELVKLIDHLGGPKEANVKLKSTWGNVGYRKEIPCQNCAKWSQQEKAGKVCPVCSDTRVTIIEIGVATIYSGSTSVFGGYRFSLGQGFLPPLSESIGGWWSSKESHKDLAYFLYVGSNINIGEIAEVGEYNKSAGFYIRCIKD